MVNNSKRKGTSAETAVVNWLRSRGWIHAERRALNGVHDRGDVAGLPGVVIEVKSCREFDLAGWCKEAEQERVNDGAQIGVVVAKKRGTTDPGEWYAVMPFAQLADLLGAPGFGREATA